MSPAEQSDLSYLFGTDAEREALLRCGAVLAELTDEQWFAVAVSMIVSAAARHSHSVTDRLVFVNATRDVLEDLVRQMPTEPRLLPCSRCGVMVEWYGGLVEKMPFLCDQCVRAAATEHQGAENA